jgi:hypothetical protein
MNDMNAWHLMGEGSVKDLQGESKEQLRYSLQGDNNLGEMNRNQQYNSNKIIEDTFKVVLSIYILSKR